MIFTERKRIHQTKNEFGTAVTQSRCDAAQMQPVETIEQCIFSDRGKIKFSDRAVLAVMTALKGELYDYTSR